ncbi:MAG: hypothetical protein IT375_31865 [Polyangiaceae bacterium]|nr:hypothetical protein [Polyangiaceae bacterium]
MSNTNSRKRAWIPTFAVALSAGTLVTLSGFSAYVHAAPSAWRAAEEAASKVAIEIPEVSCAGCSLKARKAVKSAGGVIRLGEGDPKNRLVVTYEPGPGRPGAYVDALRKAGFPKAQRVAER